MNITNSMIFGGIVGLCLISVFIFYQINIETKAIASDLNTLKNNDKGFADYILANSQTTTYLQENCKVTNDTNELTTLTCIKPKVNP